MTRLRPAIAGLLAVLTLLLTLAAVVAVWARGQVLDTDRYLDTVGPLAADRVIRDEVADKISTAITSRLDVEAYARDSLSERSQFLATPFADLLETWIADRTRDFVRSDTFHTMWVGANRAGHQELVRLLTGETPAGVAITAGRIQLDLTDMVAAVRERLVAAGLDVVTSIPPITLVVDVADADGVTAAQRAVRLLDRLAFWLPVFAVVALALTALAARDRRRAALRTLVALGWTLVGLRLILQLGQRVATDQVPPSAASSQAVERYYAILTRALDHGVRATALLLVLIGLGVILSARGPDGVRRRASYATTACHLLAAALLVAWWGIAGLVFAALIVGGAWWVARGGTQTAVTAAPR